MKWAGSIRRVHRVAGEHAATQAEEGWVGRGSGIAGELDDWCVGVG